MLNLCTPEAPHRKFFLGTSSSRKQNVSLRKMTPIFLQNMNAEKENETPNKMINNEAFMNKTLKFFS